VIFIINKKFKIISKLVYKLAIQVLVTNVLDSKLVYKRLIETNLKYKIINNKNFGS